jgi:hypothetical protein
MRTALRLASGILAVLAAASTASADVHLTIQGGRVTLVAKDATVRQILAEWERVGQTRVINAERIVGGPLTLEMTDVPEQKALDVLLRSVSGVVLLPRATIGNLSGFERIIVMPPSASPPPSNSLPPSAGPAPFQQPRVADDDQEGGPGGPQNRNVPVFAFPQPAITNPQIPSPAAGANGQPQQPALVFPQPAMAAPPPIAPSSGASTGTMPVGVSVPGMVPATPPPQPGQPGFPPPPRPQSP